MAIRENPDPQSNLKLCAFALTDCVIHIESQSAKYLRAVHRTALELAVPNLFGLEVGGYWLKPDQVEQLRKLPNCYPANEINFVRQAVEAYLLAQTEGLDWLPVATSDGLSLKARVFASANVVRDA
ncbi:MAG: hypothetical protein ABJA18_10405 [bacterium]